ncbi:MAG: hypothetical protein ACW9WZ_00130 [Nitrosopumilus sp.]
MKSYLLLSLIPLLLIVPGIAFGEEYKILIPPSGTDLECAEIVGCVIPQTLYVEINSEVFFEVDKNNGSVAFCWGTPDDGCTGGGPPFMRGSITSMTFSEQGIYDYLDITHPWIQGRIVVGLDNPPEQDLEAIKLQQEQSRIDFEKQTLENTIMNLETQISSIKEDNKEKYDKISSLKIEISKLDSEISNTSTIKLEPTNDLAYFSSLGTLDEVEQLEKYREELGNHNSLLIKEIKRLEFELFNLQNSSNDTSTNDIVEDIDESQSSTTTDNQMIITTVLGSGSPGCEETTAGCYFPNSFSIPINGKVTMKNIDSVAHTFTSGTPSDGPDGVFDSGILMTDEIFEWNSTTGGEQPYFCMLHPWTVSYTHLRAHETV